MATFRHNKRRNTGLLYEFMIRRLSQAMVDKDSDSYRRIVEILHRYYAEDTVLDGERELFEVVRSTRGVTESSARKILREVWSAARRMNARKIDIKKSNPIKEINHSFGQSFFDDHRIPDYRLLASIQMSINAARNPSSLVTESVAKIQLEEGLVQYMISKGSYSIGDRSRSDVDQLVMRIVAKRFEEKYTDSLSGPQKKILEKYVRAQVTGDQEPLLKVLAEQTEVIARKLAQARTMKEFVEDKVMADKLEEVTGRWNGSIVHGSRALDERVEEIMVFQKLIEELNTDE